MRSVQLTAVVMVLAGASACAWAIHSLSRSDDLRGLIQLGIGFLALRSAQRLAEPRRKAS